MPNPDQFPKSIAGQATGVTTSTDFSELVRFLIEPFLDSPDSLKLHCEKVPSQTKVWIRVAFDDEERGRVFGRGGRNIQAIRTVLGATAQLTGWSAYLDVYGGEPAHDSSSEHEGGDRPSRDGGRRRPNRNGGGRRR